MSAKPGGRVIPPEWHKMLNDLEGREWAREELARRRAKSEPDLMDFIVSREDLDELPKAAPMIPGVLAQESLMELVGRDGTYKSSVALDWALCLATGTPWNGKPVAMPEDRPSVLYVAAEGAYTILPRIEAWEQHRGVKVADGNGRRVMAGPTKGKVFETFHLMTKAVNLFNGPRIDDFVDLVDRRSDVGLVVLDTLRKVSGGAQENTSDMGVVVDNILRVRDATHGGSVLVLAHTDKHDNDARGYSGVEDDSDIVWHSKVTGPKAEGIGPVKLVNRKMKNGPEHPDILMTPQVVVGASGEKSLVMITADPFDSAAELPSNDADILAVIKELFPDDGATTAQILRMVKARRGGVELPESSFYKSANRLVAQKRLGKVGARYRLTEAA